MKKKKIIFTGNKEDGMTEKKTRSEKGDKIF